jgi:hypothetical protein
MRIRDRLGFDAGSMGLEEALAWAARHDFHCVDFNADQPPNALNAWDEARVRAIRQHCERMLSTWACIRSPALTSPSFLPTSVRQWTSTCGQT